MGGTDGPDYGDQRLRLAVLRHADAGGRVVIRAGLPPTLVGQRNVGDGFTVTYGVINRLWCDLCGKSAHLLRNPDDIPPEVVSAMKAAHQCGSLVSPWAKGWGPER